MHKVPTMDPLRTQFIYTYLIYCQTLLYKPVYIDFGSKLKVYALAHTYVSK